MVSSHVPSSNEDCTDSKRDKNRKKICVKLPVIAAIMLYRNNSDPRVLRLGRRRVKAKLREDARPTYISGVEDICARRLAAQFLWIARFVPRDSIRRRSVDCGWSTFYPCLPLDRVCVHSTGTQSQLPRHNYHFMTIGSPDRLQKYLVNLLQRVPPRHQSQMSDQSWSGRY